MRITNKIIQNNAVTNINTNKVMEDKLNTQLATGKAITRPSDDPVVAIRSLRLRTSLSEIDQYYEKNVPDAKNWLSITEDAVSTTVNLIQSMYSDCTTGSEGFKTAQDRSAVLEDLKGLRDQIYSAGNADYAGRYIFTGYRTSTPLTFDADTKQEYTITERVDNTAAEIIKYVDTSNLSQLTSGNASTMGTEETDIKESDIYRIRLSYDEIADDVDPVISFSYGGTDYNITANVVSTEDAGAPTTTYLSAGGASGITLIKETGELILSKDMYDKLSNVKDDLTTDDKDESKINITYKKSKWENGDLNPEQYFYCETPAANAAGKIVYNAGYLTGDTSDEAQQKINYDVGFGQEVQVNTLAGEIYTHDIGRNLDEMIENVENVIKMEETVSIAKSQLNSTTDDNEKAKIQSVIDAAEKALVYYEDIMQKSFEKGITQTQGYLTRTNTALTTIGNRAARVDLVENRLSAQQTSFETLTSENDDVDITKVAVELSSVQLSYEAALMATSKIAQTTLLNYL